MKKIRIGIIGAGKIAERTHLPQYAASKQAEVVAICDIIKKKADRLAGMYKVPKVYADYKKMIKEAGIDAVSVCTPNYLHAPMTIFAAKNKKHVLCEKPMSITVKDMKAMIKACRDNKVTLMVEQSHRFDPAHEVLHDYIAKGTIGRILNVRGKLGHAGPEYWSTDSPWFFQKQKSGGGVSVDVGIHILDLIRFVVGKDITEVSGQTGTLDKKITLSQQ
jgi:UDP-N-acetylglucosamine 3-dehydrogenase